MKTANELIENSSAQLGCSAAVVTFAAAAVAAATYVDERLIMIMNIIHKHMCLQYNFKIYYNSSSIARLRRRTGVATEKSKRRNKMKIKNEQMYLYRTCSQCTFTLRFVTSIRMCLK